MNDDSNIIGRMKMKIISLDKLIVHARTKHIYGDLTDFGLCKNLTKSMDHIFHRVKIKESMEVIKNKQVSFFVTPYMINTKIFLASRISDTKKNRLQLICRLLSQRWTLFRGVGAIGKRALLESALTRTKRNLYKYPDDTKKIILLE